MKLDDFCNAESGPVAVLGNGPHLLDVDFGRLQCPTLGVNRSYLKTISPYHVALDEEYAATFIRGEWDAGVLFSTVKWAKHPAIVYLGNRPGWSGTVAVGIAQFLGFNPIYLLGFNMIGPKFYPSRYYSTEQRYLKECAKLCKLAKDFPAHVKIYNCCKDSKLNCFSFASIEELY